jgi:hypothetical protein
MMVFLALRSKCALLATVCGLTMGVAEQVAADTITVEWTESSTNSVGYKVHVGTTSGSYSQHFDVGSATLFALSTAVAGQRYCFAVSSYLLSSRLEGPNSAEVCGYSNAPPILQNPGNRTSTVGQPATLQLVGSDPQSQPLTYSATGLPPGLTVMASTGFVSGTGTRAGTYDVTARASDGTLTASQQFTWVMNASTGGGGGDTTRPVATITAPTGNASYTSTAATMSLGGTATDNVAVTQVRWSNNRGGSGTASGTTSWSAAGVPLQSGSNVITVTAVDAAGNAGTDTLTVTYTAPSTPSPSGSATLSVRKISGAGWFGTELKWTAVSWSSVDVYRNNTRITNTENDRLYNDRVWANGTYAYKVCARNSTTACSNTISVTFGTATTPPSTPPPSGTVTLSARKISGAGWFGTELKWTTVSWTSVDVYRDGARITNTANDRLYNDRVWEKGTYSYKVCSRNSTTGCSNTVMISF